MYNCKKKKRDLFVKKLYKLMNNSSIRYNLSINAMNSSIRNDID